LLTRRRPATRVALVVLDVDRTGRQHHARCCRYCNPPPFHDVTSPLSASSTPGEGSPLSFPNWPYAGLVPEAPPGTAAGVGQITSSWARLAAVAMIGATSASGATKPSATARFRISRSSTERTPLRRTAAIDRATSRIQPEMSGSSKSLLA